MNQWTTKFILSACLAGVLFTSSPATAGTLPLECAQAMKSSASSEKFRPLKWNLGGASRGSRYFPISYGKSVFLVSRPKELGTESSEIFPVLLVEGTEQDVRGIPTVTEVSFITTPRNYWFFATTHRGELRAFSAKRNGDLPPILFQEAPNFWSNFGTIALENRCRRLRFYQDRRQPLRIQLYAGTDQDKIYRSELALEEERGSIVAQTNWQEIGSGNSFEVTRSDSLVVSNPQGMVYLVTGDQWDWRGVVPPGNPIVIANRIHSGLQAQRGHGMNEHERWDFWMWREDAAPRRNHPGQLLRWNSRQNAAEAEILSNASLFAQPSSSVIGWMVPEGNRISPTAVLEKNRNYPRTSEVWMVPTGKRTLDKPSQNWFKAFWTPHQIALSEGPTSIQLELDTLVDAALPLVEPIAESLRRRGFRRHPIRLSIFSLQRLEMAERLLQGETTDPILRAFLRSGQGLRSYLLIHELPLSDERMSDGETPAHSFEDDIHLLSLPAEQVMQLLDGGGEAMPSQYLRLVAMLQHFDTYYSFLGIQRPFSSRLRQSSKDFGGKIAFHRVLHEILQNLDPTRALEKYQNIEQFIQTSNQRE